MSVFLTLKFSGDPKALEQYAKDNPDVLKNVVEAAKSHGLIAHRFYGSDGDGGMLALDEWPDRQSFEAFFAEQQAAIQPIMQATGVTGPPEPAFWQELDTGDAYGWGA